MDLAKTIEMAVGKEPVDLLLRNAQLVNVLAGEIHSASIAVHEDCVVGFGEYEAKETVDLQGAYVAPGFIDGHVHLESTMLAIPELARNVVPLGTTSMVADPHEIANVLGLDGIRYMLQSSEGLPLRVFLMFPSCVPATPFETSGAELTHEDMKVLKDHPRILGLAEVMNFPGVFLGDPEVLAKINEFRGRVIDGHAPGLSGKELCAYVAAGIGSDHECTAVEEAREKLRMGMHIMIREGSAAKNLDALFPLVNEFNSRNCFFVTDDMDPHEILEEGHIDRLLRKAIAKGMDPIRAIQMATLNPATYFRLLHLGAVAPGYIADLVVFEDLQAINIARVYQSGRLVAQDGKLAVPSVAKEDGKVTHSINVNWDSVKDLAIHAEGDSVNVIRVVPGQIVTKRVVEKAPVADGKVVSDTDRDILKIAVIERHNATGNYSVGLISGFGLKRGAIAGTVAHDSHNILVIGTNDEDMLAAAKHAASLGGGMAVVQQREVMAGLPLPIAGLMSDRPVQEVKDGLEKVVRAARELGCELEAPFATLSFMALTPIPELKMTDLGLFDSVNFKFVSLFDV
jgi:adenine deaminase